MREYAMDSDTLEADEQTKSSDGGGWHRDSMTTTSLDGSSSLASFSDQDEGAVVVGRDSFQNPFSSLRLKRKCLEEFSPWPSTDSCRWCSEE
jgi:hypothetical protein